MSFNIATSPYLYVNGVPTGSACCVWRDGQSSYVLSAAHVLGGLTPGTPVSWYGLADGTFGHGVTLEPDYYWRPVPGGDLDAGLALVSQPGPFGTSDGYPWGFPVAQWPGVSDHESVAICGKSGPVFATFDATLSAGISIHNHQYGRLLQFRYDRKETEGGDSGSPIVSLPDGMLVGMHVAIHTVGGIDYSWAVSAEDILNAYAPSLPGFALRP
jgi:hypothetical protein